MTKASSPVRPRKLNTTILTIIAAFVFFAALEIFGFMPDQETRRSILAGLAVIAVAGVGATWLLTLLAKRKRPATDRQADHPE